MNRLKVRLKVLSIVFSGEPRVAAIGALLLGTRTQGPRLKSMKDVFQQWFGFAKVSPF